jgi:hypothetical protein
MGKPKSNTTDGTINFKAIYDFIILKMLPYQISSIYLNDHRPVLNKSAPLRASRKTIEYIWEGPKGFKVLQ